jgi:SNF2 family DNA or RNA helicase
MKQSKKDAKKMKANQKSAEPELDASDDAGEEPETLLLDETSDEEEDIGEDYDEGKKAAISVLETAEQLSAQVLGAMTKWTRDDDDDGNSKGPAATQGMIVDGALSLSALEMSSNLDNSQVWISQKAMQQIIPDVKLSNYQLVGVNWLALLHGMKCNIEGNRDTNVNGVLADEMGLVRN